MFVVESFIGDKFDEVRRELHTINQKRRDVKYILKVEYLVIFVKKPLKRYGDWDP